MKCGGVFGRAWAFVCVVGLAACGGSPQPGDIEGGRQVASTAQALAAAPTITSFSPTKAVQGTSVTINGSGFVNGATVTLNGSPVSTVTFVSSARLKAIVPAGATSGPISVTVPAGTAQSATSFVVLPKVTDVEPLHAFVGDFVTISGSGFSATTGIKLGSLNAAFSVLSDASISAAVPPSFVSGKVTVVTPGGNAVSTTTVSALPLVSSFSPSQGLVGSSVDIVGEGFSQASAVKLGANIAAFSIVTDELIRAVVPAGVAAGKFTVETPRGNRTSAASFAVILRPTVSSFSPAASELPVTLTVNGTNFLAVSAVKVGSVDVPFSLVTTKKLTAALPLGTPSGKISVVNPAGTGTSSGTFTAIRCADADADGVCDRDDRCPGFDDLSDSDGDGTADGCDVCPSATTAGQSCGAGLACDGSGACSELTCNASTSGSGVLQGDLTIDTNDFAGDIAKVADKWCITGNLTINPTPLVDLGALSSLVEVAGDFHISGNQTLTTLHGLEQLRRVGGQIQIYSTPLLTDLSGLSNLSRVDSLQIFFAGISSLHGLENLRTVHDIALMYNSSLTSLGALSGLASLSELGLQGAGITSLTAFSNVHDLRWLMLDGVGVTTLDGLGGMSDFAQVQISNCPALTSLAALGTPTVSDGLVLVDNAALQDCGALRPTPAVVVRVDGSPVTSLGCLGQVNALRFLYLNNLPSLTNFDDLSNLTHVDAELTLANAHVSSLAPLANLTDSANLTISGLDIVDLHGLENFAHTYMLSVRGNPLLGSLHELTSLTQADYVAIESNPILSQCELDWLGTQIGHPVDSNVGNGAACTP
jgi:hypothetical protein